MSMPSMSPFLEKLYQSVYRPLFLVVLASTGHISELQTLSVEPPFLIENPQSFNLAVNPAFVLKTSMEVALSADIKHKAFFPDPVPGLSVTSGSCAPLGHARFTWFIPGRSEGRTQLVRLPQGG